MTVIYADGSCVNQGTAQASAGIGVYFGPNDARNYSGKIAGPQNSNRAEIEAIRKALHLLGIYFQSSGHRNVVIRTDSAYVIEAVNLAKQRARCGSTCGGMDANADVVNDVVKTMATCGYAVTLQKVQAHSGDPGNEKANELAYAAAKR
ncbi:hypothetical protein IWW55_000531 [Coemansia sp. RSA 2706]|nr:hypothetical protein IWW55_000531 [Coemansia sp. RSA 2706]KAJ2308695.1 hypothetical protein IWW52_005851 [Coemansia sp. RSA 2704]KAJ2314637.1 hypothetical protein IWW54_000803 [Coemansia sp. RSA 2705]KAJ2329576.1 hypothetical protein IWW51_000517 [Coemansia sp. RSA 2702]KAJ2357982.1 hypothetical protein H4S01_006380 [Coemansia sp. RSA 2610]KAJ2362206.1 hypothetical protein H4S02_011445 [Coemansia sp. RSA 2611]